MLDESTPTVWQPQLSDNGTVVAAFQSTTLSDDPHSLQIIVASSNAPILLDAIGVASQNSVNGKGSAGVSQTSIPVSTASSTAAGATSSGSKVPVGAIVGGVIGGLALLLAALIAGYFLCWRRRNQKPYFYSNASPEELLAGGKALLDTVSSFCSHVGLQRRNRSRRSLHRIPSNRHQSPYQHRLRSRTPTRRSSHRPRRTEVRMSRIPRATLAGRANTPHLPACLGRLLFCPSQTRTSTPRG